MQTPRPQPQDEVRASFLHAYAAWRSNPAPTIVAFFAGAVLAVTAIVAFPPPDRTNPFEPHVLAVTLVAFALVWVTGALHQAAVDQGDGLPPSLPRMARATPWVPVTAACGIIALLWYGSLGLSLVPAVLALPVTQFFIPAAFDRANGGWRFPIAAWRAFTRAPHAAVVTTGVILMGLSASVLTAGLGAFIALPVLALGVVDVYRAISPSTAPHQPGGADTHRAIPRASQDEGDFL